MSFPDFYNALREQIISFLKTDGFYLIHGNVSKNKKEKEKEKK